MTLSAPKIWPGSDGAPVSCREKLKMLADNHAELAQTLQDTFEDAVLMGVDEVAMRRTFATQVHGIGSARDAQTPARHSNATPIMNVSTREIPSNVKDAVEALDQTLLGV